MKGRVYCRRRVRATRAGAAALRSSTVVVSAGWLLSQAARLRLVGQRLAGAPRRALAQLGQAPPPPRPRSRRRRPTKLPSRTTAMTPGKPRAPRFVERRQLGARRRPASARGRAAGRAARDRGRSAGGRTPCRAGRAAPPACRRARRAAGGLGATPGWRRAPAGRRRPAPNSWCAGCPGRRSCRPRPSRLSAATPSRCAAAAQIDRARLRGGIAHRRARLLAPTGCPRWCPRWGSPPCWPAPCGCGRARRRARRRRSAPAR